ncbi:putative DUF3486 family phage protein [Candidatus Hepatincolaceae symbiont of Richtersius coronifer]
MARKNKIYELSPELIKQINGLLLSKKMHLSDLQIFINNNELNNGQNISRAGLGRYKQAFDKEMEDLSELDFMLQKLPETIKFDKESDIHKLVSQILSKAILKQIMGKEEIDTKELYFLAKSMKDIMSSTKDREKIKGELQVEHIKKVEGVKEFKP